MNLGPVAVEALDQGRVALADEAAAHLAGAGQFAVVGERYGELVDALYSDAESCHVETRVTFEDGRSGMLSADVAILVAEVYPVATATAEAAA